MRVDEPNEVSGCDRQTRLHCDRLLVKEVPIQDHRAAVYLGRVICEQRVAADLESTAATDSDVAKAHGDRVNAALELVRLHEDHTIGRVGRHRGQVIRPEIIAIQALVRIDLTVLPHKARRTLTMIIIDEIHAVRVVPTGT